MDKFLNWFQERSTSQKIIITVLVTIGLLAITGGLYILTTPKMEKTNQYQNNINQTAPTSSYSKTPKSTQPTTAPWKIYQEKTYQISYPPDFSASPGVINGGSGGTSLALKGKIGSTEYTIGIQVTDSLTTPVKNIYEIFRGFGYREEETTVDNLVAKKFSGKVGEGSLALQDSAVIFENRGKVYKIQLDYNFSQQNSLIEQTFINILSTFRFI